MTHFNLLLTRIPVQERCYSLGTAENNYRALFCGIFSCDWCHSPKVANCPFSLKLPNEPNFLTSALPNNSQKYAIDKMLFFGGYCACKYCLLSQSLFPLSSFCTGKPFGLVASQWQYYFGTGKHSCSLVAWTNKEWRGRKTQPEESFPGYKIISFLPFFFFNDQITFR